ncbi:TIGR00266 family protein [Amphritea balenae]|uniref:TIGR00266 family protein n=1 Tax=Amphritea balenae TaxID=452629 RepID=A0A3P1SVW6_9GAMM|nr:TIGR00266 family protein [Amphritea balenae]RRD01352.1 TIGR00266 family protein [Amphritea balenae]GGK57868.1 TIGR00266 family protein [Amphritea balenae]
MKCHKVDYEVIGSSMPMLEVELDPGETVIAEAGSMNYMEQDIGFETKMGDGADPEQGMFSKLFSAGKRMVTGESLFMTHFNNEGETKRKVAFAAPYPGMVVPVDMAQIGERLYCQKDAFICAALGTRLSVAFSRKLGAGFFGGEGFILQKLEGDGMAFIQAGGTVVKKELNNETLRIDTGCLVGFSEGIEYDIEMVKGLKSMFLGGEGLWLATLSGTGTVWVQSLPFSRLADRIIAAAPSLSGTDKGES